MKTVFRAKEEACCATSPQENYFTGETYQYNWSLSQQLENTMVCMDCGELYL